MHDCNVHDALYLNCELQALGSISQALGRRQYRHKVKMYEVL